MGFDPVQEDGIRLMLETMRRGGIEQIEDPVLIARCIEVFQRDPAALIATDADRSFHLTAMATVSTDYQIPFMSDEAEAEAAAQEAEGFLQEAVDLDGGNWDAKRMLAGMRAASNEEYLDYLIDHRAEMEEDLAGRYTGDNPYDREYRKDVASRPRLRWLSALAARALVSGRYGLALDVAEESLRIAPHDPAGIALTALLALAKLEVEPERLEGFFRSHVEGHQARTPGAAGRRSRAHGERRANPWMQFSRMALAYRALDFDGATDALKTLLRSYRDAARVLYMQVEYPDGLFCRVQVTPGSPDELALALSESIPLIQEGAGTQDASGFALWIAQHELVQKELERTERHLNLRTAGPEGGEA